jgi:spore maturation protein CgeB
MKITIFGLAMTSSWGNGHATTFRSLCSALRKRGNDVTFFEHDVEWYASNRDMPEPPFCKVINY